MTNTQTLIAQAYSAFNRRDIDSALALMSENVSWPKASEGGRCAMTGDSARVTVDELPSPSICKVDPTKASTACNGPLIQDENFFMRLFFSFWRVDHERVAVCGCSAIRWGAASFYSERGSSCPGHNTVSIRATASPMDLRQIH